MEAEPLDYRDAKAIWARGSRSTTVSLMAGTLYATYTNQATAADTRVHLVALVTSVVFLEPPLETSAILFLRCRACPSELILDCVTPVLLVNIASVVLPKARFIFVPRLFSHP